MKRRLTAFAVLLLIIFILFLESGCLGTRLTPNAAKSQSRAAVEKTQQVHAVSSAVTTTPCRPFPQHLSYAPGTIRPNHRSQAQQDDDVRAAYDDWKDNYLKTVAADGETMYRVSFGFEHPETTVSEGQGYGMFITVLMAGYDADAYSIFNGLWRFARAHPSNIDNRLMAWKIPEPAGGADSAFDGDADIAYALLLADAQWGSNGEVNYRLEAQQVISGILESTIGPQSRLPMLGDWTESNGSKYNQYTPRSSDFMPTHFRAYGYATGDPVWNDVLNATQQAINRIQNVYSPDTGLLPDFMEPLSAADHRLQPASPNFLEDPHDGGYYYNAGRDPWRIGADALLNADAVSMTQTQKIANWIADAAAGDPNKIKAGYQLDGTPIDDYFTTFFVAPFGVALMTPPAHQQFLNDIYSAVYNTRQNYYEDSVTLLSLLVMTGNYWQPGAPQKMPFSLYLPLILRK